MTDESTEDSLATTYKGISIAPTPNDPETTLCVGGTQLSAIELTDAVDAANEMAVRAEELQAQTDLSTTKARAAIQYQQAHSETVARLQEREEIYLQMHQHKKNVCACGETFVGVPSLLDHVRTADTPADHELDGRHFEGVEFVCECGTTAETPDDFYVHLDIAAGHTLAECRTD